MHEAANIFNAKGDGTPNRNRYTKVGKARIKHIKEGNTEAKLDDLFEINKVYFSLKWCSASVGEADDPRDDRQVLRL